MNLHEYQAKKILKKFGVSIPEFGVASSVEEAQNVADNLGLAEAVLKIQVHAGGRGKAGGVKFAKSREEIASVAKALIGMKMVNQQTGPAGVVASLILISKPTDIAKEFYLGAVIDRDQACPLLIASPEGGMEIEVIAEKSPEKILKMPFAFDGKLKPYQLLRLTKFMGWSGDLAKKGAQLAQAVAKCFIETDASLLEINPLVQTPENEIVVLDAKLSIDDNAFFRQAELLSYYDPSQVSEQEAAAKEFDLAYIAMDGNIGCMVNGAGLAMATMDIIKLYGGSPANFLDVGGGASKEKVSEGFRIILSDPKVKAVLVNIFGGIMNCATLAEGVIHACKEQQIKIPIIVRMEGTNVEEGKRLLKESHLKIITAEDLKKAAELAVDSVKRGH
ncbi:MAG: ADP-forming succinate--CoA ligase subunit beta [Chlamydiae bacterium CG10_big_fil_rev_8_21_14_0_10_42_34]|nr:MAG: ADP-forming succinate--CoA ligase subunit beta [Chlamydiae bacterium CG10_big_fil_rev_8_21_14_0_10_42_34]